MNVDLVKALCVNLGQTFGHKRVAEWAGISPGVWSTYCSYDQPDKSIPLFRAAMVERASGRRDFTDAMAENAPGGAVLDEDPHVLFALALEALSKADLQYTVDQSDRVMTEAEKRRLLALVTKLSERAGDLLAAISATETPTRVTSLRRGDV